MDTTTPVDWHEAAARLAADLRAKGSLRSALVERAVLSVPRHLFIPDAGLTAGAGLDPAALLTLAYADRPILTHTPDDPAGTYFSNSQPGIVTRALEAADLADGTTVLEIGTGTGWMAALIADITGRPVHTIDHSAQVIAEARQHLDSAGSMLVFTHHGDGYPGLPGQGPYQRIIATLGVAGIPPAWIAQLAPGGSIIAPLAHGGMHPLVRVTLPPGGGAPVAELIVLADFMTASGPLYGGQVTSPAVRMVSFPQTMNRLDYLMPPGLDDRSAMADLWMYLAGHDTRTTCATAGRTSGCAMVDESETAAVFVQPDGLYASWKQSTSSAEVLALAAATANRISTWECSDRPALTGWRTTLAWARDPVSPLWAPTTWTWTTP